MNRALILVLTMCLGCDKGTKTEPPASTPPTTTVSASAPESSAKTPEVRSSDGGASSGTDGVVTAATLFEGLPPAEIKLGKTLGSGPKMAVPDGWKGDANRNSATVMVTHPSGAKVMHHYVGPGKVSDANRNVAVRAPLEAPNVVWEADVEARFGIAAFPGTAAHGTGKSGKHDADFYSFRYASGGHAFLIVVALPKGIDPGVRQQAIAAARSGTPN